MQRYINERLDYLDALRGIAILGVITVHTNVSFKLPILIKSLLSSGSSGVQLFFMVSAFTIMYTLDHSKRPISYTSFLFRRFFRIAPLYYVSIVYYMWQNDLYHIHWHDEKNNITIGNIVSNISFLHGFYPLWFNRLVPGGWSIAIEMMFYSCIPILYAKIKNLNFAINLLTISIFLQFFLQFILKILHPFGDVDFWGHYIFMYFPTQFPIFILGIITYLLIDKKRDLHLKPTTILLLSLTILLSFLADLSYLISKGVLISGCFMIIIIAMSQQTYFLFQNKLLVFLGKISYGIYLVHFAILYWLDQYYYLFSFPESSTLLTTIKFLLKISTVIGFSAIIAFVLHKTIELPMQKLGKCLIANYSSKSIPAN
jgi:peptidoglycan/LPS O-acetylase OafA/YrhL